MFLFSFLLAFLLPDPAAPVTDFTAMEQEIVVLTNAHRRSMGLDTLVPDAELTRLAREHSSRMAKGKVPYGHDGFDIRFKQIKKSRECGAFAENVFLTDAQATAEDALQGWLDSKDHRKNIEGKLYTHIGLGIADSKDGIYLTQVFAQLPVK